MKKKPDNLDTSKLVRDVMIPAADGVNSEGTVKEALDDMNSEGVKSSPVTDPGAQFIGTVSGSELNRKVGGKGHDPAIEPLKGQMNPESVYCFDDDTLGAAKVRMEGADLQELPVLNHQFMLLGTVTLRAVTG